jgi:hypothetical protein
MRRSHREWKLPDVQRGLVFRVVGNGSGVSTAPTGPATLGLGLLLLAALWLAVVGSVGSGGGVVRDGRAAQAATVAGITPRMSAVPVSLAAAASSVIGGQERVFRIVRRDGVLVASGGGVSSSFTSDGVRLSGAGGVARVLLVGVGYGDRLHGVSRATPVAHGSVVSYRLGGLRESYRDGPSGLEQAFILARRPAGPELGPLTLALRLSGSLRARRTGAGTGIVLASADGRAILNYGGLSVRDATGRSLPAEIVPQSNQIELRVWDRGARYPLTIDPLIFKQWLGAASKSLFGISVALSADGNTALIGGSADDNFAGAAWVFIRKNGSWTEQQKLTGNNKGHLEEIGVGDFGSAVALSGDGNTGLVAAFGDNGSTGAVWVFIRKGDKWSDQQKLANPSSGRGRGQFGDEIALSGDGTTALIGDYAHDGGLGAAWVFVRKGSVWIDQRKLTGFDEIGDASFGDSVALSDDGDTALVGGSYDHGYALPPTPSPEGLYGEQYAGAAWVFTRKGDRWISQQKLTVVGPPAVGVPGNVGQALGWSAALSADGDTALIGTLRADTAYVFVRKGDRWSDQRALTPGSLNARTGHFFGFSVALSSSGNTALIGDPTNDPITYTSGNLEGVGAVWIATRTGRHWSAPIRVRPPDRGSGRLRDEPDFGWSVALSGDGGTALVSGPWDGGRMNGNPTPHILGQGTWVFGDQPGTPSHVSASAGDRRATVSFRAASTNGSPITKYTVTASPGGAQATGKKSPITVTGLSDGTRYRFTVTASNRFGTGPPSAPSNAVTPKGAPGAPMKLTAFAGVGYADVSFAAPPSNGSPITKYTVVASPGGAHATGSKSPIVVTGLTAGTAYTLTVTATNAIGTGPPSAPSNAVTPVGVPGAPTNVTAVAGNASAKVSFTAPASDNGSPVKSYTVISSPGGAHVSGAASPITVAGLTDGTKYTFTVTANNEVGPGPPSKPSNAVTPSANIP